MKFRIFLLSILLGMSSLVFAESLDRVVAVINDNVVTESEFQRLLENVKKQAAQANATLPSGSVLKKQVLDQLINRKLQLQMAEQVGFSVSDKEVVEALQKIAKDNKISLDQLYQAAAAQGLSQSEYRKEIHDEMMIQQLQQKEIGSKISVSMQEIDEYLHSPAWNKTTITDYHLEDILIPLKDAPTSEEVLAAKNAAEKVLRGLPKNTSLLAAVTSDDVQKIDLGWRKLPEIPSAFSEEVSRMKQNDMAGPIRAGNGFHIIRLAAVRGSHPKGDLESQRREVQMLIFQRKFAENLQSFIAKIRGTAYIKVNP